MGEVHVFAFLLLACAPSLSPDESCVDPAGPPGDPIYRSCAIHREGMYSADFLTDEDGRTIASTYERNSGTTTQEVVWEGPCAVFTKEEIRAAQGELTSTWDATRTCDEAGNQTSLRHSTTSWRVGSPTSSSYSTTTTYTYDDAGRPIVAVTILDGDDDALTTVAWYGATAPRRGSVVAVASVGGSLRERSTAPPRSRMTTRRLAARPPAA